MAGLSQTQSLSQSQVLAPQLQQSLQILQVPMLELRNLIQQELQSNPTVEEDQMEPTIEDKQQEHEEFQEEFDRLAKLDEEWRDYMSQSQSYSGRSSEEEERRQFFFDSIVGQQTLQQHLLEQVASSDINETDRQLAELIIGNIDDTGFLQTTPEEISQNTGMEAADLERILELVQTFHPVGVGSRNLRECLLIQLRRLGKEQSLEFRMVDKHLEDLGKRRFPEIARRLGTTAEQVQRAANFIGTLDPKPGQIFTPDPNNYVLPDVNVERVGDDYQITLNGEQIPHLRISNTYKDLMSQEHRSNDVKDYIRDKIRSGKFLIKSIHQRQQTISNIAHEIVARQKDFLDYGPFPGSTFRHHRASSR
jgi:RNA polymerase sigma-54 factor